jgi:diguanylate cyclase (GGDEF)-like protein
VVVIVRPWSRVKNQGGAAEYPGDMASSAVHRFARLSASRPESMRRVALAFLCAGALASFAGTLVPDPDTSDHGALLGLSLACAVLALGLAAWRRPTAAVLAWLPALGLALALVAVAVARPLASTPSYALLPVLVAAYYGSPRRLAVETAAYVVGLAFVLALWAEPGARVAVYIGTAIPTACVAVAVAMLRRRVDTHVDGLEDRADADALTGLLNHGAFGAALEDTLDRSATTGRPATLLLLDIDHFKLVNDRFGHLEGDRVLRAVSEVLTAHKRRGDLLGRIGGEEFALLLPEALGLEAHGVAERIRVAVREATALGPCPLTISIGIATTSPALATADALLHAADRALYAAKARGRDRSVDLAPIVRGAAA